MRTLRQIKDLINNMAKRNSINPQTLLRNYMMERLLERITLSSYKDNFILKGGMLISSLIGVESRSTVDMDTMMKQKAVTLESIKSIFDDIISIDIDDFLHNSRDGVIMNVRINVKMVSIKNAF